MTRDRRTSRADALWSTAVAVLSVLLVGFAVVVLLLSQRQLHSARAELRSEVMKVARSQHLSPRDPAVLRIVQHRLPHDIELVPSADVLTTGRVELISRRARTAHARDCLLLPLTVSGHITGCDPGP